MSESLNPVSGSSGSTAWPGFPAIWVQASWLEHRRRMRRYVVTSPGR